MKKNKYYQELLKLFNNLTYTRNIWEVFYDFVEMTAISISNQVDLTPFDDREKQYIDIVKKYTANEQELFPEMFEQLFYALEHEVQAGNYTDILGSLFHELKLHDKYKGQFFTPQHICNFIGAVTLGENDETIINNGFVEVLEPACGSGAMVLGLAQAAKICGYNPSEVIFAKAIDIDIKCVYMCYIQLSLYEIPAIVIHGNSLSFDEWSRWYTPAYIMDGWSFKNQKDTSKQYETQAYKSFPIPGKATGNNE